MFHTLSGGRPTRVIVNLDALRHNLAVVRALAPGAAVCGVVKADAYGHGAVPVSRALADEGIDWLAVATVQEGMELREAGITTPILAMFGAYETGYRELINYELTPNLWRPHQLEQYAAAAKGAPVSFHVEIDTGMRRVGLRLEHLPEFLNTLARFPNLHLQGAYTHFANADLGDLEFGRIQQQRFNDALALLQSRRIQLRWIHAANSAATINFPAGHGSLVRPGLLLYGLDPRPPQSEGFPYPALRPAMSWTTTIINVQAVPKGERVSYGGSWAAPRDSVVAAIPVGYADGYPRRLSNRAQVLVRGHRAPIAGTVCMDVALVDVTHIPQVAVGDEVVLLGRQNAEAVTAYELAHWADTIPYEIVCGVSARVERCHVKQSASSLQAVS